MNAQCQCVHMSSSVQTEMLRKIICENWQLEIELCHMLVAVSGSGRDRKSQAVLWLPVFSYSRQLEQIINVNNQFLTEILKP